MEIISFERRVYESVDDKGSCLKTGQYSIFYYKENKINITRKLPYLLMALKT